MLILINILKVAMLVKWLFMKDTSSTRHILTCGVLQMAYASLFYFSWFTQFILEI